MRLRLPISGLAGMLHASSDRWKVMMILKAYFDDAGTHAHSDIVGVGGFVGPADLCQSLEDDWQAVLDEFAQYGVRSFHSYSCEWGEEDFSGISREIREAVRNRLARLVASRQGIAPIWCAVVNEDWDQIGDPAFRTAYPSGYHFCFRWCVDRASRWTALNAEGNRVGVTVSEDNKNAEALTAMFEAYRRAKPNTPLRAIAFASYRDVVALQPADMIAYETFREWSDVEFGPEDRPLGRVPWETLGSGLGLGNGGLFTKAALEVAVRDFREHGLMKD